MVDDELSDGERIARLLSSEIHGHERGVLGRLSVADARETVEPTEQGAFAFAVAADGDDSDDGNDDADDSDDGIERRVVEVYVHPDRSHVEFRVGARTAAEAGHRAGLRVRPKAVEPPRTLVFVENGAEVKPALRVVRAVGETLEESG
ncbi:hypothetical protein BRC88_06525 [Halobacteriales archaeon QS_4_69_225]|nr:MAG: hypothetical protein BRC88_06525 [Halobacteriales archaeon QS_4_69_225]